MRRDNRSAGKTAGAVSDDESALLIAVRCAQRDDEAAKLFLLAGFEPLCLRCAHEAHRLLPGEDLGVCQSEATCQFLLLLNEFDEGRGVPFVGFLKAMLSPRVLGWARKEYRHHRREPRFCEMRRDECEEDADRLALSHGVPATEPPEKKTDWNLFWEQVAPDLTPRQRQAMEFWLQGLTEREIAGQMRITAKAAHDLKEKASKRLRKFL